MKFQDSEKVICQNILTWFLASFFKNLNFFHFSAWKNHFGTTKYEKTILGPPSMKKPFWDRQDTPISNPKRTQILCLLWILQNNKFFGFSKSIPIIEQWPFVVLITFCFSFQIFDDYFCASLHATVFTKKEHGKWNDHIFL